MSFENWNKLVSDTKKRREELQQFYKSKQWQQVREYILKRDNYLCSCGKPATIVHHIKHLSIDNVNNPAVSLNEKNLISVCEDCHRAYHKGDYGGGRAAKEKHPYPYEFDDKGLLVPKKTNDTKS